MGMFKRKKYLTDPAQVKFVALVVVAFLVMLVFLVANLHGLLASVMPRGVLAQSKGAVLTSVLGILVILAVTAAVIVRYTHRFFGPLKRLRRELEDMAEKKQYWHLRVRTGDYLESLVEGMNLIIDDLQAKDKE